MSESDLNLAKAPIIEAVIDIDCDMPPGRDIKTLEAPALERYRAQYPHCEPRFMSELEIESKAGIPSSTSTRHAIQGYLFRSEDRAQLVQVRTEGFSFNRLAPYSSLDNYLPEIERTWKEFIEIASPIQVRVIRLRYVNKILLPLTDNRLELDEYLEVGPRLTDPAGLQFAGFLNQSLAIESSTGNEVNTTLASQPAEDGKLPIVFDIIVARAQEVDPGDWPQIASTIRALRKLKNQVFKGSLTEKCLLLFQ